MEVGDTENVLDWKGWKGQVSSMQHKLQGSWSARLPRRGSSVSGRGLQVCIVVQGSPAHPAPSPQDLPGGLTPLEVSLLGAGTWGPGSIRHDAVSRCSGEGFFVLYLSQSCKTEIV